MAAGNTVPGGKALSQERTSRFYDERDNPCVKEGHQTEDCLKRNYYEKSKCEDYFLNYANCKKFWGRVYRDRRRQGLRPFLPLPEDREEAKRFYLPKFA